MVFPITSFMTETADLFPNIFENYSLSLVSDKIHLRLTTHRLMGKQNDLISLQNSIFGFSSITARMIGKNGYH